MNIVWDHKLITIYVMCLSIGKEKRKEVLKKIELNWARSCNSEYQKKFNDNIHFIS